jgi:regulator of cell morphogenesis and NO signaling
MNTTLAFEDQRVSDIALEHSAAVAVFTKYNIDFCCGGKQSLKEACEKSGISTEEVQHELFRAEASGLPGTIRFDTWDVPLLTDFIVQHHHQYVKQSIPQLQQLLAKVCHVHGDRHPYLFTLKRTFNDLAEELLHHMQKEEVILFPEAKRLFTGNTHTVFDVQAPMAVMENEHEHAGNLVKSIRQVTRQYNPPADACPTFNVTYRRLQEFDHDLMQHIHLENNVLFEKVRAKTKTIF